MRQRQSLRAASASVLAILLSSCNPDYPHGDVEPSGDGKTYLQVLRLPRDNCGELKVDGQEWRFEEREQIEPGVHTIECGAKVQFRIPSGVVYHFDHWGS